MGLLPADATTQFALIPPELATNPLKTGLGTLKTKDAYRLSGRARIDGRLELQWDERFIGEIIPKATRQGFGAS